GDSRMSSTNSVPGGVAASVAKVHQAPDTRGLPYTAEFQRFGMNMTMQTVDAQTGGNVNIDNNVDDDTGNCLLCQEFDPNYGGIDYQVANFRNSGLYGTDPAGRGIISQRTFGPFVNTNGTGNPVDGDET